MKIVLSILLATLVSLANAADFTPISWSDLQGKLDYDDPFLKLTEDQRYYLSIYARIQTLEQYSPKQVTDAMRSEKQQAEDLLREQDVDIEYLLDNRERITELRREAASKTNPELDNSDIEIGGFMLALDIVEGMVSEFLLVPYVGACIHTPPPPPNQILLVQSEEPIASKSRFEPVKIRGKLKTSQQNSSLFLVDGQGTINSGYLLEADTVSKYE